MFLLTISIILANLHVSNEISRTLSCGHTRTSLLSCKWAAARSAVYVHKIVNTQMRYARFAFCSTYWHASCNHSRMSTSQRWPFVAFDDFIFGLSAVHWPKSDPNTHRTKKKCSCLLPRVKDSGQSVKLLHVNESRINQKNKQTRCVRRRY